MTHQVHIIGGGLAGSEAAWQLAQAGVKVRLSEMRGSGETTPAHHTDALAELVCSNSFRSDDAEHNAVGLDRKSTRLNSSHANISYAVFCLKKNTRHQSN